MKGKLFIILGFAISFLFVGYLGYFAGRTKAAIDWSWVPKEHNLLYGSMQNIEALLSRGETGTVVLAVGAYQQTIRTMTNEFAFYLAAQTLCEQTAPNLPHGGANGTQPFGSETNRTPAAAAARRSP